MTQYIFTVAPEQAGERVDKLLAELLEDFTRSRIQKIAESGQLLINGSPVKVNYKLKAGDEIVLHVEPPQEVDIVAEDIPLDIVYEDEEMLVVNKPQGMVVHPAAGNYSGTLVNALMAYCGDSLSGINGEKRPGILHRIDKDTSGLLLVAKTDRAHRSLAEQIKAHSLTRAYRALVHGNFKEDGGTIDAPIGRHPIDRKKMTITTIHAREAVTHFRVLERFGRFTYIECRLETGRTHQIRVHMKYIGHPLAGDPLYGPRKTLAGNGQYLHARLLGFKHPRTGKEMVFTAPLPAYFVKMLEHLRKTDQ